MKCHTLLAALGLFSSALLSQGTAQTTCNVLTDGVDLITNVTGSVGARNGEISLFSSAQIPDVDTLRLVSSEDDSVVGAFYFQERFRLSDGFSLLIDVNVADGFSDGFSVIIQNDKIDDSLGALGPNLGFVNGAAQYIAIAFDLCPDRGFDPACNSEEVRIDFKSASQAHETLVSIDPNKNVKLGRSFIEIHYLQDSQELIVEIGEDEILRATLDEPLDVFFAEAEEQPLDKFGFIGMTASNNNLPSAATIDVESFTLNQKQPEHRLVAASESQPTVDFGSVVSFNYVIVDSCDEVVVLSLEEGNAVLEAGSISATLTGVESGEDAEQQGIVYQPSSGEFLITFLTPNLVDNWRIDIRFEGVRSQRMPITAIQTQLPDPGTGLSTAGLAILISVIALLLIGVMMMVVRLNRYRTNLKENEDNIAHGKVKQKIDIIEKEIDYSMNPMVAPLDELKNRLLINKQKINELKLTKGNRTDAHHTVEQLEEENKQLRAQMAEMKKSKEKNMAGNRISAMFTRKLFGNRLSKNNFEQERA